MPKDLTNRECQVLEQVVQGLPTKEIAHRLGISDRTVEIHRRHAREKLGAKNTAEMVRKALTIGRED